MVAVGLNKSGFSLISMLICLHVESILKEISHEWILIKFDRIND